jgi:hypothetical protein
MRTPVIIATALLAVAATAAPAAAARPERLPTPEVATFAGFCGGSITLTVTKNNVKTSFAPGESGFTDFLRGNFVVEVVLDDGGPETRSVVLRTPGQVRVTGTEDRLTISSIGRTLLVLPPAGVPELKALRDAQLASGLPDLALVTGRVDTVLTLDPDTGLETAGVVTYNGKVTDVCDLFA